MKYLNFSKYVLLAVLLYIPIFGYLDIAPFRIWDEARLAMNAYEMVHNGHLIVTYADGVPDMWSTKPPFMIWCQAIMIKLIGFNELAIRLPSAFAAFFTCILLIWFSVKYLQAFWLGFIAVIVLITSLGYVNMHSIRSGDYDAMLTFYTTAYCICFYIFMEEKKIKYLYVFFILLSLSVLTKSITGLLFLPGLAAYCFWKRQFVFILRNKHTYFGIGIFLLSVLGYYLTREFQNPGYLQAVSENELGGRFLTVNEGHEAPFWFFYNGMITYEFNNWYLLVPCGIFIGLFHKIQRYRDLSILLFLLITTFFFIISYSETKCEWYDIPLYPFMALAVALFINIVFQLLDTINVTKYLTINILPFIFLFLIFVNPYTIIIDKTYLPKELERDRQFYDIGYYLKSAFKGKVNLENQYLVYQGYNTHNILYLYQLREKGVNINQKSMEDINVGDIVILSQSETKKYCENAFLYTTLSKHNDIVTLKIDAKK